MDEEQRGKWNERYSAVGSPATVPAAVLADNLHLLPAHGVALDLACGLGANALLLAAHGLQTHAWDYSDAAIARLGELARKQELPVYAAVRDVLALPPESERFDVIVVSRFLDRALCPALMAALRPGGLLFYQTFTRTRVDDGGPSNPDYRLGDNELLALFAPLQVVVYREEGRLGRLDAGFRNEAMLIGTKAG